MERGDWITLLAAAVLIPFCGFHLAKRWTRPRPAVVEFVNGIGWTAILALAVFALLSLRG